MATKAQRHKTKLFVKINLFALVSWWQNIFLQNVVVPPLEGKKFTIKTLCNILASRVCVHLFTMSILSTKMRSRLSENNGISGSYPS
jgi:hypothetical protein